MTESWDIATGPGVTALGLAAARSVESGRPDSLIEDPFARELFEASGTDLPMLADWPQPGSEVSDAQAMHLHGSRYIGLRTRFYDDAVRDAAAAGVRQVVLLGAGLDTRAFRLDIPPELWLWEIDQGGVLTYKDAVLGERGAEPVCRRAAIGLDLREDWPAALGADGFDTARPTGWIAEGLLPYLDPESQAGLLQRIGDLSAPQSMLAFDRIAGDPAAGERLKAVSERSGIDMTTLIAAGDAGDLARVVRDLGWEALEESAADLAGRYGRDLSDPFGAGGGAAEPPWLDTVFLSARLPG